MQLFKKLPDIEPTIGGFIILYIKREFELRYEDFDYLGFGKHTVSNWTTGKARPSFDDVLMICEHYNRDISTATAIAKLLRNQYRSERNALKAS